jgi:hypothetical protein
MNKLKFLLVFSIGLVSIQMASAQEFSVAKPDTARLFRVVENLVGEESLAYVYLISNYSTTSGKDSVEFGDFYECPNLCAFVQKFEKEIEYSTWDCTEEGRRKESISFPKMKLSAVHEFIEHLFFSERNSWVDEMKYESPGVGCNFQIEQTKTRTIISFSCGC